MKGLKRKGLAKKDYSSNNSSLTISRIQATSPTSVPHPNLQPPEMLQ
jgi:hypothetical protein